MRDEDFIEKMEETTQHRAVSTEAIEKWQRKLPIRLLHYWPTES
ncbi:GAD-like domain-containing protein [Xenorhabdus miraniensis]|nr:GAD-like domain-containing protein [Xenorhabdus miraniensis]